MIWANKNVILFLYALEAGERESSLVTFQRKKYLIDLFFFPLLILQYVAEMNYLFCNLCDQKRGSLKLVATLADVFLSLFSEAEISLLLKTKKHCILSYIPEELV